MARTDDGSYNTIVFDDIFCCPIRSLAWNKQYYESHPGKIAVATGGANELTCVDCGTNQHDYRK